MIIRASCGCHIDDNCQCAPTMSDLEKQLQAADALAKVGFQVMGLWYHGNPLGESMWKELKDALAAYEKVRGR